MRGETGLPPPLSVGPSAGAGGGLVFNMEKDGHSRPPRVPSDDTPPAQFAEREVTKNNEKDTLLTSSGPQ